MRESVERTPFHHFHLFVTLCVTEAIRGTENETEPEGNVTSLTLVALSFLSCQRTPGSMLSSKMVLLLLGCRLSGNNLIPRYEPPGDAFNC